MAGADRPAADPTGPAPALAPSWAAPVAVVAVLVLALLAGLVWHATRLNPVDAWMMGWQERAYAHANRAAKVISHSLPVALVLITVVVCAVGWLAGRRDAVVLALTAAPAALAVEVLLKDLVDRTWNGDPALLFPSGHVAVATAAAVSAVLVVRVVPAPRETRIGAACVGGGFVLLVAGARLVQTVHSLTDVVGGVSTGLAVALGAAMAITAWYRGAHVRAGSSRRALRRGADVDDAPAPGAGQSRS